MIERTRRTFITGSSSLAIVALAGCSGDGGDGGASDGTTMAGTTEGNMTEAEMAGTETPGGETTESDMTESDMNETDTTETETMSMEPTDPAEATRASVDRFSEAAGTLHVRSPDDDLPGPDEPVDFDENFLSQGLGPDGSVVQYYDFDVQPVEPAPIYAFFHENGNPVEDQLNVVGVVPGEDGYNDFWRVTLVTVPDEYEANTVTSESALLEADYSVQETDALVNCPVVPEGSTASMRHGDGDAGLVEGWYDGTVVGYFQFTEASLEVAGGAVPVSPIYVSFNVNPGTEGGGPPSGFKTEPDSQQTHNVLGTLPGDSSYSPLWSVNVYDNADFESVSDLDSAMDATVLAEGAATVNCPVVSVE